MSKDEFFKGLANRPADVSPLMWVASLNEKPPESPVWLMEWLRSSPHPEAPE